MKCNRNPSGGLRFLLTSDVHYTEKKAWYGVSSRDRCQLWAESISREHSLQPLDGIIFNGDTSLDHYLMQGSFTADGVSGTDFFVKQYVSQLPKDIPMLIGPGNHELYSDAQWRGYTGQSRQNSILIRNQLFILLDTFCTALEPNFDGQLARYTPVDVDFIREEMAKHPGSRVWLVAHYFDAVHESEEFRRLVREEPRIGALFAGHSHKSDVVQLGEEYGGKVIAQTGNFSYSYYTAYPSENPQDLLDSFWGVRDLVITDGWAESNYILADSDIATIQGQTLHMKRHTVHTVRIPLPSI